MVAARVAAALAGAACAAVLAVSGCGPGRPAQPRTVGAVTDLRDATLHRTMAGLCTAENAQEMGVDRLGQLYDATPGRYVSVQRGESAARAKLRGALAALAASGSGVTGADRTTVRRLVADEDGVLDARGHLLGVLGHQPANARLSLMTGPPAVAGAYRKVADAYLAAGRDFLAAGLAECATPLITVLGGPGQDEASAATVEFRIAAACRTVGYTTRSARPVQTFRNTATLGSVMQPGTHSPGDRYGGSAGPVTPPPRSDEVVVLTSAHYPVDSARCAAP